VVLSLVKMDSSEMLSCSLVDATNQLDFTVSDISLSTIGKLELVLILLILPNFLM
jgi:hypothetical protein